MCILTTVFFPHSQTEPQGLATQGDGSVDFQLPNYPVKP